MPRRYGIPAAGASEARHGRVAVAGGGDLDVSQRDAGVEGGLDVGGTG
ncbi:MAG: hypothetical protein ACRD07_09215 [Acidimicrobiales bacterium]